LPRRPMKSALGAALFGEITLARGRSRQQNFDGFRVIRNREVPPVDIHIVESAEHPTGLGEIPYPPVAPALCSAICAATGTRLRRLPVVAGGLSL
jgi:isoquinoline 1-oxidoreductase beta subunit